MNSTYIVAFEEYLISEKNSSENTRLSYMRDLRRFSEYLTVPVERADHTCLENYILTQKSLGRSAATLARNIASIEREKQISYMWYWRRLLIVPWAARRSNQSILKEISPECSLEGLMLKLKPILWPPDGRS